MIELTRVVKGDSNLTPRIISLIWTSDDGEAALEGDLVPGKTNGLWFLRASSAGWRILPVIQGYVTLRDAFVPMPPGAIPKAYAYSSDLPVSEKVARALGAAVESATEVRTILMIGLRAECWINLLRLPSRSCITASQQPRPT